MGLRISQTAAVRANITIHVTAADRTAHSMKASSIRLGCKACNLRFGKVALKEWLRRFKGVATYFLPNYLGWRRMIVREGDPHQFASRLRLKPNLKLEQSRCHDSGAA